MSEETKPTRTLMYLGTEMSYQKSISRATHSVWLNLEGIENNGRRLLEQISSVQKSERECLYSTKLAKGRGRSGSIWVFEAAEDTKIYPRTGRCMGRWQNDEDVIAWQAREETVCREVTLGARAARGIRENLSMEALKPFREAYSGLTVRQRGILLSYVIAHVTGGRGGGGD
ncbi:MAG: hypothetical protein AMXMBFR13_06700 [Phycisphaerae bacterium]